MAVLSGPQDADGDSYYSDTDCDDNDSNVYPNAMEVCYNQIDDDCDGFVDYADDECVCGWGDISQSETTSESSEPIYPIRAFGEKY
eukprot:UN19717